MPKTDRLTCQCAFCRNDLPFSVPEHLADQIASGNVVVFAGAGISTENPDTAHSTFYKAIARELGVDGLSFPELMTRYCEQPDGRIRLLQRIKQRFDYFEAFDDFYLEMTRFHRAVAPMHTITDFITTNWDSFFEQVCELDAFVYDSDLAMWDSTSRHLIKLHGSITNLGSIVATERDYKHSFNRLNDGPLGAQVKSLLARKTVIYTGYSISDVNYVKLLTQIAKLMGNSYMRQSYFISPQIDQDRLRKLPIHLVPILTDGAFFFEQIRTHLRKRMKIISEENFDACEDF